MTLWNQAGQTRRDEATGSDGWDSGHRRAMDETPDDIAALFSWANLRGMRYRDFSASRRLYREQVRARASESLDSGERSLLTAEVLDQLAPPIVARREGAEGGRRADFLHASRHNIEEYREDPASEAWHQLGAEVGQDDGRDLMWKPAPVRTHARLLAEYGDQRDSGAVWNGGERAVHAADPLVGAGSDALQQWQPGQRGAGAAEEAGDEEYVGPAWLYDSNPRGSGRVQAAAEERSGNQESVSSTSGRWSALHSVIGQGRAEPETPHGAAWERRAPLVVVFSLAGGVGKTSLLASLGRALSACGEQVALGDAAPYSVLPFYFGANELRPGATRAFAPPTGSADSPILLMNYDLTRSREDEQEQRRLVSRILRNGAECSRILLDLPASAEWLLRRIATLQPTVVVPLTPDMNSVIGLEAIERFFEQLADSEYEPLRPVYLLNQFDESLTLHVDMRDVLERRLGDRLLGFTVRRSPLVSEALAEGMTVIDYSPESGLAQDYFVVAAWLRAVSPAAMMGAVEERSPGR